MFAVSIRATMLSLLTAWAVACAPPRLIVDAGSSADAGTDGTDGGPSGPWEGEGFSGQVLLTNELAVDKRGNTTAVVGAASAFFGVNLRDPGSTRCKVVDSVGA